MVRADRGKEVNMWKHEILSTIKNTPALLPFPELANHVYNSVLQSQQFFIDDIVSARESVKSAVANGTDLNFKHCPVPFHNTLLCFSAYGLGGASLYCEYPDNSGLAMVVELWRHKTNGYWFMLPMFLRVLKDGSCLMHKYHPLASNPQGRGDVHFFSQENNEDAEDNIHLSHCGSRLIALSLLLSCKNISQATINPPPKVNKKRERNGKQPLYSYHVLTIKTQNQSITNGHTHNEPLSHNRVHFCRGHFKQYTPDNPLFGKHTGLYWWEPSLRGQNKDGFVDKDYIVEANKAVA
jgi:hypothetical protein